MKLVHNIIKENHYFYKVFPETAGLLCVGVFVFLGVAYLIPKVLRLV